MQSKNTDSPRKDFEGWAQFVVQKIKKHKQNPQIGEMRKKTNDEWKTRKPFGLKGGKIW